MKNKRVRILVAAAILAEVGGLWLSARRLGGNVEVRCSQGHLFTTLWIPGASFKAIRLGNRRFQRCPVGHHWAMVRPLNESELTEDERLEAAEHHDARVP